MKFEFEFYDLKFSKMILFLWIIQTEYQNANSEKVSNHFSSFNLKFYLSPSSIYEVKRHWLVAAKSERFWRNISSVFTAQVYMT